MKLKLDTAAIAGAVAATEANKAEAAAVDFDRIKADFRKRLGECLAAKREVVATIQKNIDFIRNNAAVKVERWGDGSERWYAGDEEGKYHADEYTQYPYDVEINLKDGVVTGVSTDRLNLTNALRLGMKASCYTYPAIHIGNEGDIERIVRDLTPAAVDRVAKDIAKTEDWYETIHLPLVGLLFEHIRDKAARLAAQLRKAEDEATPKTIRRVIIEVVTETRD